MVPLLLFFGAGAALASFGAFLGVSKAVAVVHKKQHGDEPEENREARETRIAQKTAWCIVLLLLFMGFLVLRYYIT